MYDADGVLKKLADGGEGRTDVGLCRKDLSKAESAPLGKVVEESPEMERRLEERL